jgi:hypothetical protein
MKFQVGDKVTVLHSNEDGEVIDIINDKMVLVEVRGVRFPAYVDQLDFPYFKMFTQKKLFSETAKPKKYIDEVKKEKSKPLTDQKEDGVWITFLPVMETDEFGDDVVETLKLHLVNKTSKGYKFEYKQNALGRAIFELKNEVDPFRDFYLHDIPFEDMNDNPSFDFEFSLVKPEKNKAPHYEYSLKLRAKQIFSKIGEIREKNEPTFSYKLFDVYPDKLEEDKVELGPLAAKGFKIYEASKARHHMEAARSMVDLHIEKLTDNWKHLSNFEILTLQLKTFEKYYELAVAHHQPSFTVVHGLGSGKLRDEIHDILRLKKEVKSFVNQYHSRYGYGATEIYFQY